MNNEIYAFKQGEQTVQMAWQSGLIEFSLERKTEEQL